MQSKGAQNLAQSVVMVITNNASLSMNTVSPQKKPRAAKRNMSVDVSSGEDGDNEGNQGRDESNMRMQGQATP